MTATGNGILRAVAPLLAAWIAAGGLGACTPRHARAAVPGELVVMLEQAPQTLDPVHATDAYGVRIAHQLIFETLVTLDDDLRIAPGAAASWERPSPRLLRFHLRPGDRFSDGTPLEAADVAYTLESLMAPETASPYGPALREKIAAVRAVDAATVEVALSGPYAAILQDLMLPVRSRHAGPERPLLGSGPFRFESRAPTEIVLARNAAYTGPRGDPPSNVERIRFKVVRDENTRILKLRKGDIDLAINVVPPDKLPLFETGRFQGLYRLQESPGLSFQYLGFNLDDPILSHVEVRRAVAEAIDVEALIRYRQKGHSTRAAGLLLPEDPYALPGARPPPYDPAEAARLLDAAGFPLKDGRRFSLQYKTSTDRAAVIQARAIQSDLKKLGIAVEVRAYEWGTFYRDVQRGNFQLFSLRWLGVSDPDFYYELFHSSRVPPNGRNRMRYRNREVDRLLEEGRVTTDPEKRKAIYHAVERDLLRDLPWVPLWHNHNVALVSPRVQGFRLHPTGGFQHLPDVRLTGE